MKYVEHIYEHYMSYRVLNLHFHLSERSSLEMQEKILPRLVRTSLDSLPPLGAVLGRGGQF